MQNNDETIKLITEVAEKAAPIREKIISELKPKVGHNRKSFVTDVVCCEQNVDSLEKLDKLEAKELKSAASWEYNKVKDYLHFIEGVPNEDSPAKLEVAVKNLVVAKKWLEYIGHGDLLRRWLNEYGIDIVITKPNKHNTFMNARGTDVAESIKNSFAEGVGIEKQITESVELIKVDSFEELPDDIRYSKENKRGINASQFDAIVTIKALKAIEEEKASKKAAALADKAMDNIEVNNLIFNVTEPDSIGAS